VCAGVELVRDPPSSILHPPSSSSIHGIPSKDAKLHAKDANPKVGTVAEIPENSSKDATNFEGCHKLHVHVG